MKRADLIRHIESHGCVFAREGSKHTKIKDFVASVIKANFNTANVRGFLSWVLYADYVELFESAAEIKP